MTKNTFLGRLTFCALVGSILLVVGVPPSIAAPVNVNNLNTTEKKLVAEHVFGGFPSTQNIYIRNGYVLCFNPMTKTPNWVAYHVKPEYRQTPERKGRFSTFRNDPDIAGEATDADYTGLYASRGFAARGHLAPYTVMGGDRDGDGKLAENDKDDELTVYQAKCLSNIAPQHHDAFNGQGGLWGKQERWVQDDLVEKQKKEVWVFAGCIFGPGNHEKVGKQKDIWVPPMF